MAPSSTVLKASSFTSLALIAFAANSVLCRLALGEQQIDAASFTAVRLASGALVLFLLIKINHSEKPNRSGNWFSSLMLFLYAMTFSYAYLSLDTGTGALILFGAVQFTMIAYSLLKGKRLTTAEWLGVLLALLGLIYLLYPGINTPSLTGFVLMLTAGVAWGAYTLLGSNSANPLAENAANFIRTLPLIALVAIITLPDSFYTQEGLWLAFLSGAIASGVGYTIWYTALRYITAIQAAVVQILVPVLAGIGGVIFMDETVTIRLLLSAILVLSGILLVVISNNSKQKI